MLRTALAVGTVCLMTLGYAASQFSFFAGTWQDYAQRVDKPQIAYLATFILLALIALAFIPESRTDER